VRKSEAMPTKYFRAKDLPENWSLQVEIELARLEKFEGERGGQSTEKMVVFFRGQKSALVVGSIVWDQIVEVTGEEDSDAQTDRAKSYPDHGRQESFLDIGQDTVGAKHERCLLPTLPASTARRGSCRPSITQRPAASRPRSSRRWRDNIRPDAQRNISPAATGCARKLSGATRKLPAASKTDRRVVSHVD
jgi:hypothetical protein